MKALKIVGIVFGILLLLTGGGLAAGSVLANKGQAAFQEELTNSGYAGPVDGTVQSVSQSNPVVVKVSYTDNEGKQQTGQGSFAGGQPPQVGDSVSTYYSTSDPRQVVVVNLPGLSDLSSIADSLRTAAIACLIVGSGLLLAAILALALGRKQPAAVAPPGQMYPPQQPPAGYPTRPYPPQQPQAGYPPQPPPGQPYPPQPPPGQGYSQQPPPGQPYPPQPPPPPPGQGYSQQPPPGQPYPPQQDPPER
jgi:hypothetical protein